MFEIKIILVINSCKKKVYLSFYFNLKIMRFFCWTLYMKYRSLVCKCLRPF